MHTHYIRNKDFDKVSVWERFLKGVSNFKSHIVSDGDNKFKVVGDSVMAVVSVASDGVIEVTEIVDEDGLFILMVAMGGVGLTVNDQKPYPGEYMWGTENGKCNNEPDLCDWDKKNLRIVKNMPVITSIPMAVLDSRRQIKPDPNDVFFDRVAEHAKHILPLVQIPGFHLNLPLVPMIPIFILSKVYDGYVGQETKKFHGLECGINWMCFKLDNGKISFKSDLRFFEGGNVYDETQIVSDYKKFDIEKSISLLVSSSSESNRSLISTGEDAFILCNPTPTKAIRFSGKTKVKTKFGEYSALCRINSWAIPFYDGNILYYINKACDSLLVTVDDT